MPAVNTGGFQIGVTPNVQFADPRLLAPRYQDILPAAQQGFGFANQIQAAPIQRQLQQIALQQEQAKLAQLPVEQQLMQIRLANASQPVDSVQGVSVVDVPRAGDTGLQPMLDENGDPVLDANGQQRFEIPAGYTPKTDQMIQSRVKAFNPVTGQIAYENRNTKVEKTAEQIANEQAVAGYRSDLGTAALQRASNAANKLALGKKLSQGVNPTTGTLVVTVQNPDGSIEQVDTGQIPPPTLAQQIVSGLGAPSPAPQNLAVGQPAPTFPKITDPSGIQFRIPSSTAPVPLGETRSAPVIDESTRALIGQLSQAFNVGQKTAESKDKFVVGKTYTDANGNSATYLGNGQWQENK